MKCIARLAATGVLSATSFIASANNPTILVLDGSGSMWGQIGEVHKIEIARNVIREVLEETSDTHELGLVAYGHNRKGDCGDIESLVSVGTDHTQILNAVDSINPKGKTPLSDAVVFAANRLRYKEVPATVILISDGIETCNADPCEVGRSLEASGVDFTAHVIGFDVVEVEAQAQLSCLAQNTGGRYLSAANATELVEALQETVVEAATPEPLELGLIHMKATELEGGFEITSGLDWKVTLAGSDDIVFDSVDSGGTQVSLAPGVYDVFVSRRDSTQTGERRLIELRSNSAIDVTIALPLELTASVRTDPQGVASVNSDIVVYWEGPDRPGDYVTIVKAGSTADAYLNYEQTASGQPIKLRVPPELGDYEVRYMLGTPTTILASVNLQAIEAGAQLDAPASVAAGSTFEVTWQGPAQDNDWITIVKPGAKDRAYKSYATPKSGVVELKAELTAGEYEIRYVMAGRRVIARRPIIVTDVSASLMSAEVGLAGAEIQVEWTGPAGQNDWVTVVPPDAKDRAYTSYFYARTPSKGVGTIRLPLERGEYELRYVQSGRKILARRPISVSVASASLTVPAQVVAGSLIEVDWTGPDTESDYIAVVKPEVPDDSKGEVIEYFYTKKGNPGSLYAPIEPGEYDIRYFQRGKKLLTKNKLVVTEATASLSAPESAKVGASITVAAQGPNSKNDIVALVKTDAQDKAADEYFYTKRGMEGSLDMPLEPGVYELRYVLRGKRVLARKTIEAVSVDATLDVPDEVQVEQPFTVAWAGPGGQRDIVVIAKLEQPENRYIDHHYTKRGSPANLKAPKEPGTYEIRYLLRGKKVIRTELVTVLAD